jgi:uncharacterized protein (DUF58 family)
VGGDIVSGAGRAAAFRWRQWGSERQSGSERQTGSQRPAATPPSVPPSAPPAEVATKAAFLRRLELDVTRRLDGLLSGDYLAYASGPGTEAAGARHYAPGDDARRIDWNLTARALTPHVRTTEADRELETCIVVDRSASLDFGTAQREKREVAIAAVASFGVLTIRAGNRLSLLIAGGDQLVPLPARSGREALLGLLSVLYDTPRRETGPGADADLTAALARVERMQRRRGQIIVISDFLDASDWAAPLRRLALRHQVVAAQITDPRELQLPAVGMLAVVDTETGEHLHVQTNSAGLRTRFAAVAAERQARIGAVLADAGVEHLRLSTDRDWLLDVAHFVRRRRGTPRHGVVRTGRFGRSPSTHAATPGAVRS